MFDDLIKPFKEKLENLLKFGSLKRITGSNGKLQNAQISTLRGIEKAVKMGQFGFNSKAPNDSRIVVARIGNENVIISNEKIDKIIDISQGNTIVYNEMGNYVKVEDDTITSKAPNVIHNCENFTINATSKFTVNSPLSEFSDNVNVIGLLSASAFSGLNGGNMTTNVNINTTGNVVANDLTASGKSFLNHTNNGYPID